MPTPLPNPSPEAMQALRRLFDVAEKMETQGDPKIVGALMAELREMGLHDIPKWNGISSSVRQYAWNVLAARLAKEQGKIPAEEPMVFLTTDAGLLAQAAALKAKYGIEPVDIVKWVKHRPANKTPEEQ